MPICPTCGAEHEILDPIFRRPEAYVQLSRDSQEQHAQADDNLCRITLPECAPRYFVRGTMPVDVEGHSDGVAWGLWAEVAEDVFSRVLELWSNPDQACEPPFDGTLANSVPTYLGTLDLKLQIQLTGPTSRPEFQFARDITHPFVQECLAGIDVHRASEWLSLVADES
ncbi:MAG: DUF2199 domain-containing protein [Planctomycetota bacterium]|nr:MAG: DUF2199 domain-containing protein [Planctomycetota bacterium]